MRGEIESVVPALPVPYKPPPLLVGLALVLGDAEGAELAASMPPNWAGGLVAELTLFAAAWYLARVWSVEGLTTPDIPLLQWDRIF